MRCKGSALKSLLSSLLLIPVAVVVRIATAAAQAKKEFLEKRWLSTNCPLFARFLESDGNGDCVCPLDKSACYEDGRAWCHRSDGSRDYHYFSMTCEVCTCHVEGSLEDPGSSTREGQCKASGVGPTTLPDSSNVCTCPADKPLCISRNGLHESAGCNLNSVAADSVDAHRFLADCYDCACRKPCPSTAASLFADSFGDCACSDQTPTCFEDGAEGCTITSQAKSNSYFASTCGERCSCRAVVGTCEPNSCVTSTDCAKLVCTDCDICQGISRCTQSGVISEYPNAKGNCECGGDFSCFQPGIELPGCPIAPFGIDAVSFRANCLGCRCETADFFSLGVQCPAFAASVTPNRYGDCQCPHDTPDCYQGGVRWCERSDLRRDLYYFSVDCADCECRPSSVMNELERQLPCPNYSRFAISDVYRNCQCPLERPLCVQGSWLNDSTITDEDDLESLLESRPGPLCNTTHGWASSNSFRWDCGWQCQCVEVEGEGSRLREIQADELIVGDGNRSYMKQYMYVDVRIINTLDSVTDWAATEVEVTTDAKSSYVDGVVGGLSSIEIPVGAMVQSMQTVDRADHTEPNKESVRTMRIRVDFGVMWAWGRRLVSQSDDHFGMRSLVQEQALKTVDELTARETNLLLNFQSIFNDRDFKIAYDNSINTFLNQTWELRKSNASTDAAPMFAPVVELVRLVVDGVPLDALSIVGPLAPAPPLLQDIARGDKVTEQEGNAMVIVFIAAVSCVSIVCAVPCCFFCGRRIRARLKERKRRRQEKAAQKKADLIGGRHSRSPRSSISPRSPHSPGRSDSPASLSARAKRLGGRNNSQLRHSHSRAEIGRSMMLGGGGLADAATDSPRGASPRSPRAEASTRASRRELGAENRKARKGKKLSKKEQEKAAKSDRERAEMEKANKKNMKKLGDLAGLKSLSEEARKALEADYEDKFGADTKDGKSFFASRKSKAQGGRRGSVSSTSSDADRKRAEDDVKRGESDYVDDSPVVSSSEDSAARARARARGQALSRLRSGASVGLQKDGTGMFDTAQSSKFDTAEESKFDTAES